MRANVANLNDPKYLDEPMPRGMYTLRVLKATLGESARNKTPFLGLQTQVIDGPEYEQSSKPTIGRKLPMFRFYFPSETNKDGGEFLGTQLRNICLAAGVEYDDTGFDTDDFIDAEVRLTLRVRADQNGQPQLEVDKIITAENTLEAAMPAGAGTSSSRV